MLSSILWQNAERTITLLDIPQSIANAQGRHEGNRRLLSSVPLTSPFPSNEPKSAEARSRLGFNSVNASLHQAYQSLLQTALAEICACHVGPWCLSRPFIQDSEHSAKKRKLDGDEATKNLIENAVNDESRPRELTKDHLSNMVLAHGTKANDNDTDELRKKAPHDEAPGIANGPVDFFANKNDHSILLETKSAIGNIFTFNIPAKSSFYLGDCADSQSFHAVIRNQAEDESARKHFDFVLLDPPWPNRSVRRTHKTANSTYAIPSSLSDIKDLVLGMDLDVLMGNCCLVGMWITNKPAVRDLVLGEGGIFACWGVDLVEEWIWLKTTMSGEPVTQLDALWRKPYEVLLFGRKREPEDWSQSAVSGKQIQRRVIIAVPDLHSRKPCLKELVKPLMPHPQDYRALEIFARHLVEGWWSWGDECIKFNWEGCWQGGLPMDKVATEEDEARSTSSP